ncbi:hypothetical protein L3X38_015827 [Prunus dulcis]|uniref:Uncharacterized protein n=1 Tax=Prunus dulcis TaxID=3755 RepID=A0AAD4W5P2_PRUDU|nr:hypothetical protein L3X38_015827 [Prunus dulcis]
MILSSLGWADAPSRFCSWAWLRSHQRPEGLTKVRVAQRTGPNSTKHDIVLFGLGRRPPQGFVPGPGYVLTSAQKASPRSEWRSGLDPTLPSMILSSLGWADAPPQDFVPGPGYVLTSAQKASPKSEWRSGLAQLHLARYCPLWAGPTPPSRICSWELTEQTERG